MSGFNQKLMISLTATIPFLLINSKEAYELTSSLLSEKLFQNGCPTSLGLVVHTLVFFAIIYLPMSKGNNDTMRLRHSIWAALIFFVISSPSMYSVVSSVLGPSIASSDGCPTNTGRMVHAVVYCLALVAIMYLPEKK
tara:strand:+ start:1487 stop:1900 length:414 start_codon:yes stop_codon:yes gene_type:complete